MSLKFCFSLHFRLSSWYFSLLVSPSRVAMVMPMTSFSPSHHHVANLPLTSWTLNSCWGMPLTTRVQAPTFPLVTRSLGWLKQNMLFFTSSGCRPFFFGAKKNSAENSLPMTFDPGCHGDIRPDHMIPSMPFAPPFSSTNQKPVFGSHDHLSTNQNLASKRGSSCHVRVQYYSHSACGLNTSVILIISFISCARSFVLLFICNLVKMLDSLNCSSSSHHENGHSTAPL